MTGTRAWWDEYPGRLKLEEGALRELAGQAPVLNEKLLQESNVRQYTIPYPDAQGHRYELMVTFADLYPYFRVEVTSDHRFGVHQQPNNGALCLLRGEVGDWDVGETAAELIADQMPKLLADRTDTGQRAGAAETGVEAVQAVASTSGDAGAVPPLAHVEPYSSYYAYQPGTVVHVDGSWPSLAAHDQGELVLGLYPNVDPEIVRAAVLTVVAADGTVLCEADEAAGRLFGETITGRWVRLSRPPADGGQGVLHAALESFPDLAKPDLQQVTGGRVDVIGVVFEDDIRADPVTGEVQRGDVWTFVVRARTAGPPQPRRRGRSGRGGGRTTPSAQLDPYLVRGSRSGRSDMTERIPTLRPLAEKTIAVFGTGGLGATSVVEFAKAGVGKLHLVERDHVDPGNGARWPLGYKFAGWHKLEALGQHLCHNWPYTDLEAHGTSIGGVRINGEGEPQWETFTRLANESDLVFDATAEPGINYFLAEFAYEHGVPYVVVAATEGGWGGYVARFHPQSGSACWTCMMYYFDDPAWEHLLPPKDPDPATRHAWPAGCVDPTFTGTGFDVSAIALSGVRLAVSTVCLNVSGGYPAADWNYARFEFRDADRTLPGSAESFTLDSHPDCKRCRKRTTDR